MYIGELTNHHGNPEKHIFALHGSWEGLAWCGAKYSYGVWEQFAHQGNTFPKTHVFDICSTILAWGIQVKSGGGMGWRILGEWPGATSSHCPLRN